MLFIPVGEATLQEISFKAISRITGDQIYIAPSEATVRSGKSVWSIRCAIVSLPLIREIRLLHGG